jgi:TPP-dependent pyruvate/acetoin dehydrogenase alpha subunit
MYDAELYRSKEEVAQWKERDPIEGFLRYLRQKPGWHEETFAVFEEGIARKISAAITAAEDGAWEPVEQLEQDVLSPLNELPATKGEAA